MAIFESRTYSNTRWIILGTSKFVNKSGPSCLSQKHFNKYKNNPQTSLNIFFTCLDFQHFVNFWKDVHRKIPKNRLMKSPNMRPRSIKKVNGVLIVCYQYPLRNIKWLWGISKFDNFGIIFLGPKQLSSYRAFLRNGLRLWNLDEFRKSEHLLFWEYRFVKT